MLAWRHDGGVIYAVSCGLASQIAVPNYRRRILTLPPERRSPTRQAFESTPKRAGSEIGAPRCQSSRE